MAKSKQITPERRAEIISRDILSISDIEELTGMSYSSARIFMVELKERITMTLKKKLRADFAGLIHIDDYIEASGASVERYIPDILPKKALRLSALEQKYGTIFQE